MAKLILDMKGMQGDFFYGSALIGIGTALPAYNLCWVLNNYFEIGFERDMEQNISLKKKGTEYDFPVYIYYLPDSDYKYRLYKLKNATESLLPETKQIDYLWMVQTANPEEDGLLLLSDLKTMPAIQLAQMILPEDLENLDNLLV